jgi:glycerophosphoryl diester phosphodiesterase
MKYSLQAVWSTGILLAGCALADERTSEPAVRNLDVEIIAHRGASADAPENTLASVNLAWKQNSDAVEIDIYLTRDGEVVAMHDKTPKRYGGPDTPVAEMTWDELKQLDVGAWKDPKWKGERVPLLADILPTIPEGKRLFIEIKAGPEILAPLKKVLADANLPPERTAIIGFSDETMQSAREMLPALQVYWIVKLKQEQGRWQPTPQELIARVREIDVQGLDLGGTEGIGREFAVALRDAEIPWYTWTIDSQQEAARLSSLGARGITTNQPALFRRPR